MGPASAWTNTEVPAEALRFVTLRLLWNCNLRCVMCDHPHKAPASMSPATAHRVLDQLTTPVRLAFIGGEPCLWLLRHCDVLERALEVGHHVHITTNGLLLSRLEAFTRALACGPASVQFSVDGIGALYERVRPPARWGDFVAAVRHAHLARAHNPQAVITAAAVMLADTLAGLEDLVRFAFDEGLDSLTLTPGLIYESMVARGTISEADSIHAQLPEAQATVARAFAVADRLGFALGVPAWLLGESGKVDRVWTRPDRSNAPRRRHLPPLAACPRPWKELFVNQDGRLVPCCCGPHIGPTVGHLDGGLHATWNSPRMHDVRTALANQRFDPACRCGANMNVRGKAEERIHFFSADRDRPAERIPSA